jgi:thioredoxin reductase
MKYLISFFCLFNILFAKEFLQDEVNEALSCIQHPHRDWVIPRFTLQGEPILDVAIIGGGQTGLTMAFSLKRHCIHNICVFDQNKEDDAGSWIHVGRMQTLRTPKTTTGPDLDIPVLTVKNWYSQKFGKEAWENLDYIPRLAWHDYLNWFRKVLQLPVAFESPVGPLSWDEENKAFRFTILTTQKEVFARKVILATGLEGSGGWMIPPFVKKNLPSSRYSQATWAIDETSIKGKSIAILGAGPNAFDWALEAYRMGAKKIEMFSKRDKLVTLHCFKWGEFTGFMKCFTDLSDEEKYNFAARMYEMGQPPVPERVESAFKLPNFSLHYSSPWTNAYEKGDRVIIETPSGNYEADFLILATGWHCDLASRPELIHFSNQIATWRDCFSPPPGRCYDKVLDFPYLGRGFEFTPKDPKVASYLSSLFNMTGGGLVSNGFCAGTGLTGMKYSIDLITHEICRQFFLEDGDQYYRSFDLYDHKDFDETLYLAPQPSSE